jgi:hypothetical protein
MEEGAETRVIEIDKQKDDEEERLRHKETNRQIERQGANS